MWTSVSPCEEAAARAYNKYVEHGVVSVTPQDRTFTSRFKGVSWHKGDKKWAAAIRKQRLGYYATEEVGAIHSSTSQLNLSRFSTQKLSPKRSNTPSFPAMDTP